MNLFGRRYFRLFAVLVLGGALAVAVACGGETKTVEKVVVQTVIVKEQVPGAKVVETVIVEKQVEKKVFETVIVEKEVAGAKVVETVVVEKPVTVEKQVVVEKPVTVKQIEVVVATATPAPAKVQPTAGPAGPQKGNVVAAHTTAGVPVGTPAQCVPGCGNEKFTSGVFDMPLRNEGRDEVLVGNLAESWEFNTDDPDNMFYIWHVRPNVPWHDVEGGGWGNVTADDFVFTYNTVASSINAGGTVHDNAGDLGAFLSSEGLSKIDDMTVKMPVTSLDPRQPLHLFTPFAPRGAPISSKKVFDKFGPAGMLDKFVGTGPFVLKEWVQDSRFVAEAQPDFWNKDRIPSIKSITLLAVPEPAVRAAMFETGEAQIIRPASKDIRRLVDEHHGVTVDRGGGSQAIWGGGQYYERIGIRTGNVLKSPGFSPQFPWVGDPLAADCTDDPYEKDMTLGIPTYPLWQELPDPNKPVCKTLENARLVRKALDLCIDRQALVDTIFAGLASPGYGPPYRTTSPLWREEFRTPFDCEAGKDLLKKAGYPNLLNGVKASWYAGDTPEGLEQAQVTAANWRAEYGIEFEFDRRKYSVVRPSYVNRTNVSFVNEGWNFAWPDDWPPRLEDNSTKEGGTTRATIPYSAWMQTQVKNELDKQKRLDIIQKWVNHQHYWAWGASTVEVDNLDVYRGDLIDWPRTSFTSFAHGFAVIYPPEDIVWIGP